MILHGLDILLFQTALQSDLMRIRGTLGDLADEANSKAINI